MSVSLNDPVTNPFSLDKVQNRFLRKMIQMVSKLDVLETAYDSWLDQNGGQHGETSQFLDHTAAALDVSAQVIHAERLEALPETGPAIVVANHPLGGVDGVLLTRLLLEKRPDLKVLTNEMLSLIPELQKLFIGVDVLNPDQAAHNRRGMREVVQHLAGGGALLVFPAGTVSRISVPSLEVADIEWNSMVIRLARKFQAHVLPVHVDARNSYPFYLSYFLHPRLRTALLPRAMLATGGCRIPLHIGDIIPPGDLVRMDDDSAMMYIRMCSELLGYKSTENQLRPLGAMLAIKDDLPAGDVAAHIAGMQDCELLRQGDFSVYVAPYDRMGPVMDQLTITRERTFRLVDEGTGKELDTDHFDPHYEHLFIWDHQANAIAGGYRLCKADQVMAEHGLAGLYSHSLFDYGADFIGNMGKCLEMGRSFIAEEYQRHPAILDLVWKGIGHYVARNPEYHTLFGCVSISRQYSSVTTALLTEAFLYRYGADDAVKKTVKPRMPFLGKDSPWTPEKLSHLSDIPIINKLVGRIEAGRAIPVLIRHYINLNGCFLSFTRNTGFNDSLDGLILVDLRQTPERYLKRYMGGEDARAFKERHSRDD